MEDIVRAVLTGVAIGGFAAAVVEANILAVKTLWHFNLLGVARGQLERKEKRISDKIKKD